MSKSPQDLSNLSLERVSCSSQQHMSTISCRYRMVARAFKSKPEKVSWTILIRILKFKTKSAVEVIRIRITIKNNNNIIKFPRKVRSMRIDRKASCPKAWTKQIMFKTNLRPVCMIKHQLINQFKMVACNSFWRFIHRNDSSKLYSFKCLKILWATYHLWGRWWGTVGSFSCHKVITW